jgi:membrane-bound metal-dependent hydrolase YbcI (DUF457 family)
VTGRTHLALGVASALVVGALGGPVSGAFVLASAVGALIPDLDTGKSSLAHESPGHVLALVHRMPGFTSHRGFTHSLVFAVAVYLAARLLAPGADRLFGEAAQYGNFEHALVVLRALLGSGVPAGLLLGMLSHDISDLANTTGVQLLWPLRKRFCLGLFPINSVLEPFVRYASLVVLLLWRWPVGLSAVLTVEGLWRVM